MTMYRMKLDPITQSYINIKLFRNIRNVKELRKKLLTGALNCCIINPKLILDPFQIVIATNKALITENLTTKTIFTEILFNLSISKHISKSLQKFGIDDKCKDLLIVTIDSEETEIDSTKVFKEIDGNDTDLSELKDLYDLKLIKEAYKIDEDFELTLLLDCIISRIATKDFLSI